MERQREHSPIFAHPITHEFLVAAIEDGAIEKTLSELRANALANNESFRDLNILGIYYATANSYQKISDLYSDISPETVRRRINKVLFILWQNSSEDIRNRFPFDSIVTAKPAQNASGESSLTLANIIETSNNDSEIQEVFEKISLKMLFELKNKEVAHVLTLTGAARKSGYFVRHSDIPRFFELLINAEVPVGHKRIKNGDKTQSYYFVATRHLERIKGIFDDNPELSRYKRKPVGHAFGPEQVEIPTTSELVFGNSYRTPIHIFNELGIKVRRKTFIKYSEFFGEDCPVTIFNFASNHSYFYRTEDEEQLREYIETRARQLGLLG